MNAEKSSKTRTSSRSQRKRTRFPSVEAALASQPPIGGATETTTEAVLPEDSGGTTTSEATAGEVAAIATPPSLPEAESAAAAVVVETPADEALLEASGELTTPQDPPAPPAPERVAMDEMSPVTTPESAPPASAGTTLAASDTGNEQKKPRTTKTTSTDGAGPAKKVSALEAAAKVLSEAGQPMSCKEMIATMAAKGYWTSPGGRTPDATLYSALLREITTKVEKSRFVKAQRGRFALRPKS